MSGSCSDTGAREPLDLVSAADAARRLLALEADLHRHAEGTTAFKRADVRLVGETLLRLMGVSALAAGVGVPPDGSADLGCTCPAGAYNPGNVHEPYCALSHPETSSVCAPHKEREDAREAGGRG